jgi:hypothetical protein
MEKHPTQKSKKKQHWSIFSTDLFGGPVLYDSFVGLRDLTRHETIEEDQGQSILVLQCMHDLSKTCQPLENPVVFAWWNMGFNDLLVWKLWKFAGQSGDE